jgi:hypothetical protein
MARGATPSACSTNERTRHDPQQNLLLGAIVPGLFGLVMMVAPEMILSNHLVALGAKVLWLQSFRLTIRRRLQT